MKNPSRIFGVAINPGRIFFGIAIAAMGLLTIYYRDYPYMLIPPKHPSSIILVYFSGALLFLAGAGIVWGNKLIALLFGFLLLLIFGAWFVPYEFLATSGYMHFGEWENALKELALAGGALIIASNKRLPVIIFALTIVCFGIEHFLYAKEAADYIPAWVPNHLFWMYFTGTALLASGLAMVADIKRRLAALLLGGMIFIWVIILHIPKAVAAPLADNGGEVISAFLALAYCGTAVVVAKIKGAPTS